MPLVIGDGSEERLMFLHCMRTGGTWLREALLRSGAPLVMYPEQHLNHYQARLVSPGSVRFTIVRDPRRWFVSFWVWRMVAHWTKRCAVLEYAYEKTTFQTFVRAVESKEPGIVTRLFNNYIGPSDKVLKTESLADDLVSLLNEFDIPFDEEMLRSTPRINVYGELPQFKEKVQYDRQLERLVYRKEREIFDRYGYELWNWEDD